MFLAWVAFQYAYVSLATIYSGRDGRSLPVSTTREFCSNGSSHCLPSESPGTKLLPAQRRWTQKELVSLQ